MAKQNTEAVARLDDHMILTVAGQEFARLGFEGVAMRDLAEKCSTTTSLLYYRFGSKEALYEEACQHELDRFFQAVDQSLRAALPAERGPELLAEAIFDAWQSNPNPLLLAIRDVVNAKFFPERWLCETHYSRMASLIRKLCSSHFDAEIDEDTCFAFAATAFGVGSMLIMDQRRLILRNPSQDAAVATENIQRKRTILVRCCQSLLKGL